MVKISVVSSSLLHALIIIYDEWNDSDFISLFYHSSCSTSNFFYRDPKINQCVNNYETNFFVRSLIYHNL